MFTGIKDKLLSVKKNVGLLVGEDNSSKVKKQLEYNPKAGSAILQHFQNQWVDIHNLNEENAKAAENVANDIENVAKKISSNKDNIDLIVHLFTNTNLTTNISECLNQVQTLYNTCESVEKKLVELEDLLDETNFEKLKSNHVYHLNCYKTRKQESLDSFKAALEENLKKKTEEYENHKKLLLEERQKVFQDAFKSDLETYKNLGAIPRVDIPKKQNSAILEEIQLDFDQKELEKFFNDEANDNS